MTPNVAKVFLTSLIACTTSKKLKTRCEGSEGCGKKGLSLSGSKQAPSSRNIARFALAPSHVILRLRAPAV